jgi:hypothetical protein
MWGTRSGAGAQEPAGMPALPVFVRGEEGFLTPQTPFGMTDFLWDSVRDDGLFRQLGATRG